MKLKNATNQAIRAKLPPHVKAGYDIHEIHPVKYAGSPTDMGNKVLLLKPIHNEYSAYFMRMQYDILRKIHVK